MLAQGTEELQEFEGWNHYDFMYQQGLGHWVMTSEPGNRQAAETPLNSQNVFQFKFHQPVIFFFFFFKDARKQDIHMEGK